MENHERNFALARAATIRARALIVGFALYEHVNLSSRIIYILCIAQFAVETVYKLHSYTCLHARGGRDAALE